MASLKLSYYSGVQFRPLVNRGRVVEFSARVMLCHECALELGCLVEHEDNSVHEVEKGQVSNIKWYSKGYEYWPGQECLCHKAIDEGEEVYLTVEAK